MILFDLNYLEPVSEETKIVGGVLSSTATDNTFALAYASTTPNGDVSIYSMASAVSEANGHDTLAVTITNTSTSSAYSPFKYASAHGLAVATASKDTNFESSYSNAHSISVGTPFGYQTRGYGSSLKFG